MLTIAWDIDDVLNDLMRVWLEKKWLPEHSACYLRYEDITQNPPDKLLGTSFDNYQGSLDAFRLSEEFLDISPVQEVLEWFSVHGSTFRHIAVTAVPIKTAHVSAAWVLRHFGSWIRTFHVVPSLRKTDDLPLYDRSKKDFLKWIGKVDIFIDDNEENLTGCAGLGIKCIVFPRPWNKSALTVSKTLHALLETALRK